MVQVADDFSDIADGVEFDTVAAARGWWTSLSAGNRLVSALRSGSDGTQVLDAPGTTPTQESIYQTALGADHQVQLDLYPGPGNGTSSTKWSEVGVIARSASPSSAADCYMGIIFSREVSTGTYRHQFSIYRVVAGSRTSVAQVSFDTTDVAEVRDTLKRMRLECDGADVRFVYVSEHWTDGPARTFAGFPAPGGSVVSYTDPSPLVGEYGGMFFRRRRVDLDPFVDNWAAETIQASSTSAASTGTATGSASARRVVRAVAASSCSATSSVAGRRIAHSAASSWASAGGTGSCHVRRRASAASTATATGLAAAAAVVATAASSGTASGTAHARRIVRTSAASTCSASAQASAHRNHRTGAASTGTSSVTAIGRCRRRASASSTGSATGAAVSSAAEVLGLVALSIDAPSVELSIGAPTLDPVVSAPSVELTMSEER